MIVFQKKTKKEIEPNLEGVNPNIYLEEELLKIDARSRELEDKLMEILNEGKERKALEIPQKKETQLVFNSEKDVKIGKGIIVKTCVKAESKDVKYGLTDDDIYADVQMGLNRVGISKKYGVSRSAITQRVNKLKRLGFLEETDGILKVKEIVKDLALSILPTRKNYQMQTIHITIPIRNPEIIDIVKWDRVIDGVNLKIKREPYRKVTIRKMGKVKPSIILSLWTRWIERIEQVKEICDNYVRMVARQLKDYDIDLDTENYRTNGLHLWSKDRVVESNYDKGMGEIGLHHGVNAEKIGPGDRDVERRTWIESTPTPDGIESNDPGFFSDKETVDYFMGKPDVSVPLENPEVQLPKYMKNVTDFVESMKGVSATFMRMDSNLNNYNRNIELHTGVQEKQLENLEKQSIFMKDITEMVKEVKSISKSLMGELKVRKIEEDMKRQEKKGDGGDGIYEDEVCPLCKSSFSRKYLLDNDFKCPNPMCKSNATVDSNLRMYFPDFGKWKKEKKWGN